MGRIPETNQTTVKYIYKPINPTFIFVLYFSPLHVGVNVFVVCGTMLVVQV